MAEPAFRILATHAALEATGRCFLRERQAEAYQTAGRPVPEEVTTMPCGLLPWQLKRITRSVAAARLLAAYPDGTLAAVTDVPVYRWKSCDPETLPLLCLTPAGREHHADQLGPYRREYPEVAVPKPRA